MSSYYIPDTSPLFTYSPCTNCAESDGWQSAYSPRGDGYDQTLHQAATSNSTVSFNLTGQWSGTTRPWQLTLAVSIEFRTSSESGHCDAQYSLDGGEYMDGCAIGAFPRGRHTVTIRPRDGVQAMQFFGLGGTVPVGGDEP